MPVISRRCNVQVSCSPSHLNDRSESAIIANPVDPYNLVGASKKFTDPHTYTFSLVAYASFDAGQSWTEAPPLGLLSNGDLDSGGQQWTGDTWVGISDPTVAFDDIGNAYLIGLAFGVPSAADPYHLVGLGSYKSTDGGRTWSAPRIVHAGFDDKQWACGDTNPSSPHHGNVYVVWDGTSGLEFARSTDHGATWIGTGAQPSGSVLGNFIFGEVNVDSAGNVYVFGLGSDANGTAIVFVKSTDGGNSFSAVQTVASPITTVPGQLPGGKFRLETMPTGCCGTGNNIVVAWPDYRESSHARIYYARSSNGGNSWQSAASGDPLMTGAVATAANQHDFMPQLVAMPTGEIGCSWYEFGPKGGGVTPLIDVDMAVSTDNGHTFPNRITVTSGPWDPTVDEVWAHNDPNVTFIGDYFGMEANKLGFFPFWTDTRTGVQEIFTSRIALNPADVYIRDSSSDTGTVPSPGFHWEAPDLIVRWAADGTAPGNWVDQGLQHPVTNDHYIYAKVKNNGPNTARNVQVAVTLANWPQYAGMPGTEFRYPQDWYQKDWNTAGLQANRTFLGLTTAVNINNGQNPIVGPIVWPVAQIPAQGTWHPCLLADVRADNNDSAGGVDGCAIDADPDPCYFGSYFWGNNNACQRNLTYTDVPVHLPWRIVFPFLVGSAWSRATFHEVMIQKGPHLVEIPMMLHAEPIKLGPTKEPDDRELVFLQQSRVLVRSHGTDIGEMTASAGSVWKFSAQDRETLVGAEKGTNGWRLHKPRAVVGWKTPPGQVWRMTLAFSGPANGVGEGSFIRIVQRNERHTITGGVELRLRPAKRKGE
jgi:hypothetical protein